MNNFIKKINFKKIKNKLIKEFLNKHPKITELELNNILDLQNYFEEKIINKKNIGAFFTPNEIIKLIYSKLQFKENSTICDLSCGNGAFFIQYCIEMKNKFNKSIIDTIENNIFGIDILEENIYNCKILLSFLALLYNEDVEEIKFNLFNEDSLFFDLNNQFDFIVGNPPYILMSNLEENYRNNLKQKFFSLQKGNANLCFAFLEKALLDILKPNGKIALVIPNNISILKSAENIRKILSDNINHVNEIIDFKYLLKFKNAKTYTAIYFLTKKNNDFIIYNNNKIDMIFFQYKQWHFLDKTTSDNIYNIENQFIKLNIIGGISTNCEKVYLIDKNNCDDKYYYKNNYKIEKECLKDMIKIGGKKEYKIIYPYFDNFINKFPLTYKYLLSEKDKLLKRNLLGTTKWFEYARNQGLKQYKYKILFPSYSDKPKFFKSLNEDLLFTNGYSIICNNELDLNVYEKILNSIIMDYYIKNISSTISNGYFHYHKNVIKNFSIPFFTQKEKEFILNLNKLELDTFLIKKYNLKGRCL